MVGAEGEILYLDIGVCGIISLALGSVGRQKQSRLLDEAIAGSVRVNLRGVEISYLIMDLISIPRTSPIG